MTYGKKKKDKFIEMRAEGATLAKIAKEMQISYNIAVEWNRKFDQEIGAAKAFKNEEMLEKYKMTKEKRIEMFGERLLAIQDELAWRDLSEIPTCKLFDLMIKCSDALGAEAILPIAFRTKGDIARIEERRKYEQEVASKREEIRRTDELVNLELGLLR